MNNIFKVSSLKSDIPASIVVFLVALPLCLGVALASGAPLLSGIVSGIVGGIIVGFMSKSQTSVSGPAAGLAAIVLSAITELGVFEIFLTAVVIAGVIQLIMGILKAGFIANYIPSNVIKGLLAAIGIILILKQIPHAIGFDKDAEDDFTFLQPDGENTFSELLKALDFITPGAIIISGISILILLIWDKTPLKRLKFFPASLFVVIFGVVLNIIFKNLMPSLALEPVHLANIPKISMSSLGAYLHFPDFSQLDNLKVWKVAFTIAIIASLETLLNIEAVDKMDPLKRKSPPNNELIAQGVGNIFAGILGGIPVTSVIVRSSVNLQSGNETKLSTILHGVFMMISIFLFSNLLNLIPLASLAAILIITGYKLARISIFKEMYSNGLSQFIPFLVTIFAIVFTDLLIGVILGLFVSIFYLLRSNFRNPFIKEKTKMHIGEVTKLELSSQVSFFNKAAIKETLWQVPEKSKVLIDGTYADFVDFDVLEIINDFKTVVAPTKNIQLNIIGIKGTHTSPNQIQFENVLDKGTMEKLSPPEILTLLKEGNERFVLGKWTEKYHLQQIKTTSTGQNPMAVLVGCIDSRTSPEILFDAGIGDLLTIRIAGNIINPEIIGSLEISVAKLGAKLIVVKGHSHCGAVALAMANVMNENMGTITAKIQNVAKASGNYPITEADDKEKIIEKVAILNAKNSVKEIKALSNYLKAKIENNEIGIVSAYHDISTGKVHFDELNYNKFEENY